ncbi:MAG: hypothetical protein HYZ53_08440 [Planctomycetes bacterium]|nr:hypothetical protein [Planctomycetota bacterium]
MLLADEVGLGKTIEACIVIAQRWVERRRRILGIAPATLRTQWERELDTEFSLPALVLDSRTFEARLKAGIANPFDSTDRLVICSYHFVAARGAELRSSVHLLPVAREILIQELHRREQFRLMGGAGVFPEDRLEDYLVRGLMDFDDVDYDHHSGLLYGLAGQVVKHLQSYLRDEDEVRNVLQYHRQGLVDLVHSQMQEHYEETAVAYEAHVSGGFTTLRPNHYSTTADGGERNFRAPVEHKRDIRKLLFAGFRKCLYDKQRFDSDPERRFAVVVEDDADVLKWFKPARGDFHIHCAGERTYEPDFVVESKDAKYLCEPKDAAELRSKEVVSKADAAATWCKHATAHERKHGGKAWSYLLIPDTAIAAGKTLRGLAAAYTCERASVPPHRIG